MRIIGFKKKKKKNAQIKMRKYALLSWKTKWNKKLYFAWREFYLYIFIISYILVCFVLWQSPTSFSLQQSKKKTYYTLVTRNTYTQDFKDKKCPPLKPIKTAVFNLSTIKHNIMHSLFIGFDYVSKALKLKKKRKKVNCTFVNSINVCMCFFH